MHCDPIGSVWRRWDLHFHTPASYDHKGDKGASAGDIVGALVAAGISVVAVTDHHKIDCERIRAMQEAAGGALTVLPGLELRTELGGREKIHIVGVFSEDFDLGDLWAKLQAPLGITSRDVSTKGDDNVWVPFEATCALIHELGGFVSVHAGTKTNSLERCLPSAVPINQIIKTDLVLEHVDAFELAKTSDAAVYWDTIFKSLGRAFPLLLCSDSHDIRNMDFRGGMWIKADPGFKGLLQTRNEPETRIWFGDIPPLLERIRASATKYMSEVAFRKVNASVPGVWFSGTVPLNPGLVAIIGNKGGGKSALADVLALSGNSSAQDDFAFLNADHFLRARDGLGSAFEASTTWLSGQTRISPLDATVDWFSPELVKYLPQSYIEGLCSKINEPGVSDFETELRQVIYSHVGPAERLGKASLTELIDYLTAETAQGIQQLVRGVSEVNATILHLQEQATVEYRATIQGRLDQKEAEAAAHELARPTEVPEPVRDEATQAELASISTAITGFRADLESVEQALSDVSNGDAQASEVLAAGDRLRTRIANLESAYRSFVEDSTGDLQLLGLTLAEVVELRTSPDRIDSVEEDARQRRGIAAQELDPSLAESVAARRNAILLALNEALKKLDAPGLRYEEYVKAGKQWQEEHALIVGSVESPETILGLQERIRGLEDLPERIATLVGRRRRLVAEIHRAKQALLRKYQHLYGPVQAFISGQHVLSNDEGGLQFTARISVDGFVDGFLSYIHQGRRGSFQGDVQGRATAARLVAEADFGTAEGALAFVDRVMELLAMDSETGRAVRLRDQLLQGATPAKVLDFLCGLEYLRPRFELLWNGKAIAELSTGERGTLLLLFYLLVDLRDDPLIIDQPEENLDNQTIYSLVVQAVRIASQRRQIVMITHNPNLAVVCDADEIIHAYRDAADGNRITYTTGSLENPVITKLVLDVLEGTKPAFKKRDAKYGILDAR